MSVRQPAWRCFEDEVYEAVKKALSAGYFPFDEKAKPRRGAEYPGITPGSTIKIEVSVDAYRENATEPCAIWLWECKRKGNRKVEGAAVRELYSKILEIGAARANGSLVTTIGFQRGAIDLAKNIGISLYLLKKKKLVAHTKYAKDQQETLRQIIIADCPTDFSGHESSDVIFEDLVKSDYGHLVARTTKEPDPADPWESLKKRLKERPIHAGDLHFTRDELHERR
jgi:hypothetical protein